MICQHANMWKLYFEACNRDMVRPTSTRRLTKVKGKILPSQSRGLPCKIEKSKEDLDVFPNKDFVLYIFD